uniref:Mitogen-activated protein kinase kinase kinase 5-like n=1 Tax=Tanacetum cinerariifolium TaxID=118510 RepID=A0A6L2JWQ9_TANCI|nr:mitogen-activated protein kinase kinase kinase 5-like [Tanacetum cinerariifolium]
MHWLYNASSSSSSTTDDNYINTRSKHDQRRRVHATYRSTSTPHTLPLPELSALFKRDSRRESATSMYILPSPPEDANKNKKSHRVSEDDSKQPQSIASIFRLRDIEDNESRPKGFTLTASSRDVPKHGETVSAPATPISSLAESPTTSKIDHYQAMLARCIHGCDGSSLHSPQKRVKSPRSSSSPLHKNSPIGSPMSLRDNNAHATMAKVHPLPLPPQAQISNKPDSVPKTPTQSRWQKGKVIGRGTFGSVYVGSNRETGALCAMKEVEILPDDLKSAECIKQLEQEIVVLSQLKHPNIVQYYGSEIVEDRFYIYLEYVHPGSINKYVREHCGGMTESIVRNFTRHIVSGLAYLHSTKTIHRDIKGANLLVDANGVVKLADFGMAKHLDGQVNLSLKGSPYWMAPELLQSESQKDSNPDLALAVDIWSLGCTIIEMMNGKPPWSEFEAPAAMFKVMKETPPIPETMSPDGKDFLRCCFVRNPAERPTASMLLTHRFLNNLTHQDVSASTNLINRMTLLVQKRREHLRFGIWSAMANDTRIAASLLRLHFHDCISNGCEGSVLLDETSSFSSEKDANPNRNSARGFGLIDTIKANVEKACPKTVSCTDILTLAAREAVFLTGGPYWSLALGRRDGLTANITAANTDIPSPFEPLENITAKFTSKGLDLKDVVTLSGAHTIGFAQCFTFKPRLFNFDGSGAPDPQLDSSLASSLQTVCPNQDNSDTNLVPLDSVTTAKFDNIYYKNILNNSGILGSDQALMSDNRTATMVINYSKYPYLFAKDFGASMVKLSTVGIITGQNGQVRNRCNIVN